MIQDFVRPGVLTCDGWLTSRSQCGERFIMRGPSVNREKLVFFYWIEKLVGHYFSPLPTEQIVQMKDNCRIDVNKDLKLKHLYILSFLSFMITLFLILYQTVKTFWRLIDKIVGYFERGSLYFLLCPSTWGQWPARREHRQRLRANWCSTRKRFWKNIYCRVQGLNLWWHFA